MNVAEVSAAAESAKWHTYNAWAELRSAHAQLLTDVAAKASPQVIASDRADVSAGQQELSHRRATRIDLTL